MRRTLAVQGRQPNLVGITELAGPIEQSIQPPGNFRSEDRSAASGENIVFAGIIGMEGWPDYSDARFDETLIFEPRASGTDE
jgi:hypothetical protein